MDYTEKNTHLAQAQEEFLLDLLLAINMYSLGSMRNLLVSGRKSRRNATRACAKCFFFFPV
jgi:hypothetical protein